MTHYLPLISALAFSTFALHAQVTVVNPAPELGEVVEVRKINSADVQRQLSMAPRMLVATPALVVPGPQ